MIDFVPPSPASLPSKNTFIGKPSSQWWIYNSLFIKQGKDTKLFFLF